MPASELPANAYYQQQRKRPPPPIKWLRERFEYDPDTGVIWHRKRDLSGEQKRADHCHKQHGYHSVMATYQKQPHLLRAHRLAFALQTGRWPTIIDHIDRDRANNRWSNLRETTPSENRRNSTAGDRPAMINKLKHRSMTQGFAWQIQRNREDGSRQNTTRRDFCAAWKLRQAWLAERG